MTPAQNAAFRAGAGVTPGALLTTIASVVLVLAFVWVMWVTGTVSVRVRSPGCGVQGSAPQLRTGQVKTLGTAPVSAAPLPYPISLSLSWLARAAKRYRSTLRKITPTGLFAK